MGVATSSEESIQPQVTGRRTAAFEAIVLVLAALVVVGCFGTWYEWHAYYFNGMARWQGPAWPVLILSASAIVCLFLAAARKSSTARIVIASLMGSIAVFAGYYVIAYLYWVFPPRVYTPIGWGLWLCLSSSIAALAVTGAWIRFEGAQLAGAYSPV
ncbi:MAG TPA: hypothetical protein VGZ03_01025 [Acidimicrobiales bacterium]|nr:hypothetical protein [Acidimicrobiales bacterium]